MTKSICIDCLIYQYAVVCCPKLRRSLQLELPLETPYSGGDRKGVKCEP